MRRGETPDALSHNRVEATAGTSDRVLNDAKRRRLAAGMQLAFANLYIGDLLV